MKHTAAALATAREPYRPARSPGDPPRIDPKWTGRSTRDLGNMMRSAPNFASLGAIGPDLFFFLPDFRDVHGIPTSTVLVTVLKVLEDLYNALDPYITKYEKYLGPINEDTAEEMSRLTGGLSEIVGNISGDLSSLLITGLEEVVTSQADFFGFFSLGLDRGYDDQAFFWSDVLHYRNTGQFARRIWNKADASNDDQLRAYALGYHTHVATDVTGHAFVNAIAGGPFRTHWQRHHLVENHMDSWWYLGDALSPAQGDQYAQLTESALYYDIAFDPDTFGVVNRPAYPTGGTLRDNYNRSRLLDFDSKLPDKLAQLLIDAMGDVWYQTPNNSGNGHPKILSADGRPTVELVKEAYDLFYRYVKYVTLDGFKHDPPDVPDVFPNLQFPTISEPGSGSGGSAPGDSSDDGNFWDDILDFFLAIVQILSYIVEVAVYLATLPWAVLADLVTYPIRLGLYYALELPLAQLLKSFRAGLVMTGYALPMDDEIAPSLMTLGLSPAAAFAELLGDLGDVFGGLLPAPQSAPSKPFRDREYPHSIVFDAQNNATEYRAPWVYPSSPVELHNVDLQSEASPLKPLLNSSGRFATTAGPYPAMATPAVLFGGVNQDPALRDRFETAATPGDADVVGMAIAPTAHLGDSVAFSKYLIWLETRDAVQGESTNVPLVEWNLDSDLGYGYHCWDWNRAKGDADKDPEGNAVQPPCVAPEQLDADVFPTATPNPWRAGTRLLVHWVGPGLRDPGCGPPPESPVKVS
jgi:hypothetical protein